MAVISNDFIESVVTISIETVGNNKKTCIGTGFLVGDLMNVCEGRKRYGLYLITNKHVVKGKTRVLIGFNQNGGSFSYDFPVDLIEGKTNRQLYSEHINENVDIIALNINTVFLDNMKAKYHFFPLEESYTVAEMNYNKVSEGDLVYSLGYPLNLVNTSQKNPICRLGCISRIANLYVEGSPEVNFLVDAQSFPGNSGGPVILRPELYSVEGSNPHLKASLIGILHSYISYNDPLISQQTGQVYSIMKENSGLTNVHPVDFIKDTVAVERKRVGDKNISLYEANFEDTDSPNNEIAKENKETNVKDNEKIAISK